MAQPHKYHFFVDSQKIETDNPSVTGAVIKTMTAGFNPTYQLYLEGRGGDPDRPVSDGEAFNLAEHHEGVLKFYSVPPATFGKA